MKKIVKFLCVIALVFSATFAYGQARYHKGDVLLNAGLGLGYYYAGGVPLLLSLEFALSDVITIGPYIGFTSYNYGYFNDDYKYTFLDIGGRFSYHFSELFEITNEKVDIYGGGFLGFVVSNYSGDNSSGFDDPYSGGLRLGIHAGARYFVSESFALYGEVGYGIAPLGLGITVKF